jgi:uncharacterized protein involved in exopolysaccharide biosynthesis
MGVRVLNRDQDADDSRPMPFSEVKAHVRARRAGGVTIFGVVLGMALLAAALIPPRFYATAKLAVLPAPEFTVRQDAGSRTLSTSVLSMDQVMKAETEILQSQDLHAGTLQAVGILRLYPGLDHRSTALPRRMARAVVHILFSPWRVSPPDSPAARLESALQNFDADLRVLPSKDANVIEVSFGHSDGSLAAQTVNDLLARYAKRREQLYDDPQLAVVRRETDQLSRAVQAADAAMSAFKAAHAIADYAVQRDLLVRRESQASDELADSIAGSAEQQARVAMLDRQIAAIPHTVSLYNENDTDARLQAIDASIVDVRAQLAAARVHYRDDSRKVTDLVAQLHARDAYRRILARNTGPSTARVGRSPALDGLLLDKARAATEHAANAARAFALRGEQREIAARLGDLIGEETALADLQRRKAAADAAFEHASEVLAEQHMTEAEDALRLANVRVIQPARTPLHAAPIPLLVAFAGGLLGAAAGSFWCVAGFLLRPTVMTEEGLAHAIGLPVLGVFSAES